MKETECFTTISLLVWLINFFFETHYADMKSKSQNRRKLTRIRSTSCGTLTVSIIRRQVNKVRPVCHVRRSYLDLKRFVFLPCRRKIHLSSGRTRLLSFQSWPKWPVDCSVSPPVPRNRSEIFRLLVIPSQTFDLACHPRKWKQ